jgi:hypothetical protein
MLIFQLKLEGQRKSSVASMSACGEGHTVVVMQGGTMWSWGKNDQVARMRSCRAISQCKARWPTHVEGASCLVNSRKRDDVSSCLIASQGQLGHGHTERLKSPALISTNQSTVAGKDDFPYFVQAATGMAHTSEFSTRILVFDYIPTKLERIRSTENDMFLASW